MSFNGASSFVSFLTISCLLVTPAISASSTGQSEETIDFVETIEFTGLSDGSPFVVYYQGEFAVTALYGDWVSSATYGNPPPFIQFYNTGYEPVTASIEVTREGSPFQFHTVDVYSSMTPIPYRFTGFLDSEVVFDVTGTEPNTFGAFATVENPYDTDTVDVVEITLTNPAIPVSGNPMGLDNIVVSGVYPVGGSVTGIDPQWVRCQNLTTRQIVIIREPEFSWNCEEAGLAVGSGDRIRMTIQGTSE